MKKISLFLILSCFLATNVLMGWQPVAKADEPVPTPRDMSGIIEAAPESFDVSTSAAEVLICSSGLYDFLTDLIAKIGSSLKCLVFATVSVLGVGGDLGTKCSVSAGGTDTQQMCREWVQRKQAELKKYLAQLKKLLIATYVRKLVDKMAFDIIDWIGGKTTGAPQFVTNWQDFIWGTAKEAIGDVIQRTGTLSFLCAPFRAQVVLTLPVPQRPPLPVCTLDTIMTNIKDFYNDFRSGGWLAFNEVVKPQNNPYGAWLMEMENLEFEQARIQEQQTLKAQSGYIPTEKCTLKVQEIINGRPTGNEICLDTQISIPGQAKSDLTSQALSSQMQKAEQYMITEADLLNYAKMIAEALISRLVKSAKEDFIGGQYYGEGLLNVSELSDTNLGRYSCERAGTVAMCVEDPDGTMTKAECDAACQPESYRCDRSGANPTCVADLNGTMTKAQCKSSCTAAKYSCLDVYDAKMCAIDPNGQYASEADCKDECKTEEPVPPPTCDNCKGVYVRGRYSPKGGATLSCGGDVCLTCTGMNPPTPCGAFCLNAKDNIWPSVGTPQTFSSTTPHTLQEYKALFDQFGWSVPKSCTCSSSMLPNNSDYGMGYSDGSCRQCVALPISYEGQYFSACKKVDWCDQNCAGSPTPTPSTSPTTTPKPTFTPLPP